ncbi:hypothetical protein M413DRAFT_51930, partial [Hebeloma cylindrosporum]
MRARLFPATMTQPTTAFTFRVLQQFHIHHLVSKESAYDFVGSLRRLTDNAFAHSTPDVYPQFKLVMRVWRLLIATKRLGQHLEIDSFLPHRREDNLIVHCPTCPEPHINMEDGFERTPHGNHHSNKYIKNSDPDDISLYDGRAYFPNDAEYRGYVESLANNPPEKTTCNHLAAINKQNRKKFKNMDITGIVNIQCSHVFIKSSVDLQLGEKFSNTDYGVSHAISNTRRRGQELTAQQIAFLAFVDRVLSYDIICGYSIYALDRFEAHFPDETWVKLNQLGGQTRQMNNGHRQDTIIDHHSYWNWSK